MTGMTATRISARRALTGAATAMATFAVLGTVAALWDNPLFVRMTPVGTWETSLLALLALLSGAYVALRRPYCANTRAGAGGVLGFLGVACPVCNQLLLLIFGGEFLLTYYEPIRIYVAALGVAIMAWAAFREWRLGAETAAAGNAMAGDSA